MRDKDAFSLELVNSPLEEFRVNPVVPNRTSPTSGELRNGEVLDS